MVDCCSFQMEMSGGALVVMTLVSQPGQQHLDVSFSVSGSHGYVTYRSDETGGRVTGLGQLPNSTEVNTTVSFFGHSLLEPCVDSHIQPFLLDCHIAGAPGIDEAAGR